MALIGGSLGYRLLRRLAPRRGPLPTAGSSSRSLEQYFGSGIWSQVRDRVVIDFGCGEGHHAIEMARHGARRAIGLDIREGVLAPARRAAAAAGVGDRTAFVTATKEQADVIISVDAFEHFSDPEEILRTMRALLKPSGSVLISFGPPWRHPYGAHLPLPPWWHLVFTETALMRWRADWKPDGARHFREVEGGLNCMTIRRFRRLVDASPFRLAAFECIPIRGLRPLVAGPQREWFTAVVRASLAVVPEGAARAVGAAP